MKAFKVARTRKGQIKALVEDVENWDIDILQQLAKDITQERLDKASEAEVEAEYSNYFMIEDGES